MSLRKLSNVGMNIGMYTMWKKYHRQSLGFNRRLTVLVGRGSGVRFEYNLPKIIQNKVYTSDNTQYAPSQNHLLSAM
jgi:hypothetical protein